LRLTVPVEDLTFDTGTLSSGLARLSVTWVSAAPSRPRSSGTVAEHRLFAAL
jgi:hypothetical protein